MRRSCGKFEKSLFNCKFVLQLFHISNIIDIGSDDLRGNIQKIVYPKEFKGDFTETKKSNAKTNNHSSHVATIRPVIDNIEEMFKNEQ